MKPCHKNNDVAIWGWKGRDHAQSFVLMFTLQLNIFNRNVSIGQFKAKNANKKVCQASDFITIAFY